MVGTAVESPIKIPSPLVGGDECVSSIDFRVFLGQSPRWGRPKVFIRHDCLDVASLALQRSFRIWTDFEGALLIEGLNLMSWKTALKISITVILLGSLAYHLDLEKLLKAVISMKLRFLLLAGVTQFILLLVAVLRWRILLRVFSMRQPYRRLLKITFVGSFFSLFLPSSIGGDFFRAYYVSKATRVSLPQALVTTFLDRGAGLFSLLLIGLVAALCNPLQLGQVELRYVFIALLSVFLLANLALFHNRTHRTLGHILDRLGMIEYKDRLRLIFSGLEALYGSAGSIARVVGLSLIIQGLSVVTVWLLAQGLGITASFNPYLVFVPLINLSIMVPLTINGFGLREYLYTVFFSELGVIPETAVALGLLSAFVLVLVSLPGGIIYSLSKTDFVSKDGP